MAPSEDALTPRKLEIRRKLKRPVSHKPDGLKRKEPKAFSIHTRAPARESLDRKSW